MEVQEHAPCVCGNLLLGERCHAIVKFLAESRRLRTRSALSSRPCRPRHALPLRWCGRGGGQGASARARWLAPPAARCEGSAARPHADLPDESTSAASCTRYPASHSRVPHWTWLDWRIGPGPAAGPLPSGFCATEFESHRCGAIHKSNDFHYLRRAYIHLFVTPICRTSEYVTGTSITSEYVTGTSIARQMRAEGFTRFEEIIDEFRDRFGDRWFRI